jgi:hypothetical protein
MKNRTLSYSSLKAEIDKNIIVQRLKSETPTFWKKIQKISLTLSGLFGACCFIPLPPEISWIPKVLTGIFSAVAGVSQLTTTDPSISNNPTPQPPLLKRNEEKKNELINNNSK